MAVGLHMSYRRFLAEHDADDLAQLEAFYELEPFGPRIEDFQHAQLCAATISPYSKSSPKPSDFMHNDDPLPEPLSAEELKAKTLRAFGIRQ